MEVPGRHLDPLKVLLIEDEKRISDFVTKGLKEHGFTFDLAENGDDGFYLATTQIYDAIVLDSILPGRDGLSILKGLRAKGNNVPVIATTARGELDERLEGLNLGADDYLTKPFYVDELVARLQVLYRRKTGSQLNVKQVSDLVLNMATREVSGDDGGRKRFLHLR